MKTVDTKVVGAEEEVVVGALVEVTICELEE